MTTSDKYKKHDANIKYLDKAINKTGMVDSSSVLLNFKNYSIYHSPNLNVATDSDGPVILNNNLLKIKAKLILRFSEDIQKVEYITANIFIIAFATKIYVYQKQALQKVISLTPTADKALASKEKEPEILAS